MTPDEFNKQYLCEFKPDPLIEQCVEFLRYASDDEILGSKIQGIFSSKIIRETKRIIEIEESKECGQ